MKDDSNLPSNNQYFSFLFCNHPEKEGNSAHLDIFVSGQPLGVIRNGEFELHQRVLPNGEKVFVKTDMILAQQFAAIQDALEAIKDRIIFKR